MIKKKGNLGRKKKLPQLKELGATEIIKKKLTFSRGKRIRELI